MILISHLTQKQQSLFFRSAPPPYSHKSFGKLDISKKAFTLAEVLITLTIIGVVAAMTIPTLMSKYQKQAYVTGLKKAYSQLKHAEKMIPLSQGCPAGDLDCAGFTFEITNYEQLIKNIDLIAQQFKVSKKCYAIATYQDNDDNCKFAKLFGSPFRSEFYNDAFMTADGMVYGIHYNHFAVDVNGEKGPNKWGRDQFYFQTASIGITNTLFYPLDKGYHCGHNECCLNTDFCTGKILREGKMDY